MLLWYSESLWFSYLKHCSSGWWLGLHCSAVRAVKILFFILNFYFNWRSNASSQSAHAEMNISAYIKSTDRTTTLTTAWCREIWPGLGYHRKCTPWQWTNQCLRHKRLRTESSSLWSMYAAWRPKQQLDGPLNNNSDNSNGDNSEHGGILAYSSLHSC